MESSLSVCACARLCVGLILLVNSRVNSQGNDSSSSMIPVPVNQVSNQSKYHDQVEFITDFLLNNTGLISTFSIDSTTYSNEVEESNQTFANNLKDYINETKAEPSSRENNTTPNDLQVIPKNSVPASFSSVLDTLPVHPRIPRGSVARRKTRVRLNRHSTRVNPGQPVRFLLPPPIHKCSEHSETVDLPFNIKPIVISSTTPLIPVSAIATPKEYVVAAKPIQVKSEQKEPPLINIPSNRRVFVPPPPRHLIPPPFSQENHFNYQYQNTESPLQEQNSIAPLPPQNNFYEFSTKAKDCDQKNKIESSSVVPIVVNDDNREVSNWSFQSSQSPPAQDMFENIPIKNEELLSIGPVVNLETSDNIPPINYDNLEKLFAGESTTSEKTFGYNEPAVSHQILNSEYGTHSCEKNHSSVSANMHQTTNNFSPQSPQQFNLNNEVLQNQIFSQNIKEPVFQNVPQEYPLNQLSSSNQLQHSLGSTQFSNDRQQFNKNYPISPTNEQKLPTPTSEYQFIPGNVQPIYNHAPAQNKPSCNESNHLQFPLIRHHNHQEIVSDKQYDPQFHSDKQHAQQYVTEMQYNHQQYTSDKQYSPQQFPTDKQHINQQPMTNQYNQQPFTSEKQYDHHQVQDQKINQQPKSDNIFNEPQFPSNNLHIHQQLHQTPQYNEQLKSNNHYNGNVSPNEQYNHDIFKPEIQYNSNKPYDRQQFSPNNEYNISFGDLPQFSQASAVLTSVTKEPALFVGFKSSSIEHFSLRPTTPLPPTPSIEPFPVLRGPNIEQALFETGNFQVFDTDDSTVAMMNKPLLTQEVARAGMKITANMKMEQIKAKMSRGKLKYNHLNQFNFPDLQDSKSSKLQVAETSYYKDRRGVQQLTESADLRVIPGTPGVDYPTLHRPPLRSDFSCRSVENHRGYVADPSTRCQVFYICVGSGPGEAMLCPNGTLFSQDYLVCDWWFNIDCQPYS